MNDKLLEILAARPDFTVMGENKKLLDIWLDYLDHGSLFMTGFEPGEDPVFLFSNDAQVYRFAMSQIRGYVLGMKQGIAVDWPNVPFEYMKKG